MIVTELAASIDHAVLAPDATVHAVAEAADACAAAGVRGLCVASHRVPLARARLEGTAVRVVSVAGFPAAAPPWDLIVSEAIFARREGAVEIDVVLPAGALRDGDWASVRDGLRDLVATVAPAPVKAIVEASAWTDDALSRLAATVVAPAGAAFFKTGTGVYGGPFPPERITRLRAALPERLRLKVSGGIRDLPAALAALDAGADVLGMSRTFEVLRGLTGS